MRVKLSFPHHKSRSYTVLLGFIVANLIYGLLTFVYFASKPSLEQPVFLVYSRQKLFLLGVDLLLVATFLSLFILMIIRPTVHQKILGFFETHINFLWKILIPALVVIGWLVVFWIYSVYRSAFSTLIPLFVWLGFIYFGISLGIDLSRSNNLSTVYQARSQWSLVLGMVFLGMGVLLAFLSRYANVTVDEADHMVVGGWMAQGLRLYSDVFSHHPPLVYYWSAFIVKLFGWDIGAIRGAFAVLWFLVYWITAKITKLYLPIGLFVFLWGGLGYFYYGNLILYQAFSGLFLIAILACLLSFAEHEQNFSRFLYLWFGLINALILFADPRMGVVTIISFTFLVLREVANRHKPLGERLSNIAYSFVSLFFVLAIGITILGLTSSLSGFYQNFVWFNEHVYGKYVPVSVRDLPRLMWSQIANGLFVFRPEFRTKVDLFRFMWSNGIYTSFDGWIFGGFFYRLIMIIMLVVFVFYKKSILGVFLYVMASFLLTRSSQGFHAGPFVMMALFLAAYFITEPWRDNFDASRIINVLPKTALRFIRISVAFMFTVLLINTIYYFIGDYDEMITRHYEKGYRTEVASLQKYECKDIQPKYLIYPLDPLVYWYLGRLPASRFSFMLPWVAEVGQTEVINGLINSTYVIVRISLDDPIGGIPAREYLRDLTVFLNNHYHEVEEGIWVSPTLFEICHSSNG